MNSMPTYDELLKINHSLGEKIHELESKIQEMNLEIDKFLAASTMYRELTGNSTSKVRNNSY